MKRCVSVCSCGHALTIAQGISCTVKQLIAYTLLLLWLHVHSTDTTLQIINELSSENEELKEELEQAHAAHEDITNPSRCWQCHACQNVLPLQRRILNTATCSGASHAVWCYFKQYAPDWHLDGIFCMSAMLCFHASVKMSSSVQTSGSYTVLPSSALSCPVLLT